MKILVLSDSHGYKNGIITAIRDNPDAGAIVFLGDGERDFDAAIEECGLDGFRSSPRIFQVRGNCDRMSMEAESLKEKFAGESFFITHGYAQKVKYGLSLLREKAKRLDCGIALFGHTHSRHLSEENGVILFNPGSVRGGSYGIVTVNAGEKNFFWCDL